jgi:hypothetical protein
LSLEASYMAQRDEQADTKQILSRYKIDAAVADRYIGLLGCARKRVLENII